MLSPYEAEVLATGVRVPRSAQVRSSSVHVAVLWREYIEAMLCGRKTIESRLSVTRCAPFDRVAIGDVIYVRERGGQYRARARVAEVRFLSDLTPTRVAQLRSEFNGQIGGTSTYWRRKRSARYATLIWLEGVEPVHTGPVTKPMYGRAWVTIARG